MGVKQVNWQGRFVKMADETEKMAEDLKEKMLFQKQQKTLDEIQKSLSMLNDSQQKIGDILKKQETQELKERTQDKEPEEAKEEISDEEKKEMGALRKTFAKSFASIKDTLSPGGLLKGFGLLSGSPIFMLLGDKFDELISQYGDFRKESKEAAAIQKESVKDDFMEEGRRDEELQLAEQQNELLEEIRDKELVVKEKDDGFLSDILGGILPLFSKILPKSLAKFMPKMLGGLGIGAAGGGLLGGGMKLLKGGGKLLGKLALPLALISGAFDFVEGFKGGEEITGREGLAAKIQGGISNVISGLTFGLLDPKKISKGIDIFMDKLTKFFMAPIELIQNLFSGENILESLSEYFSKLSFGLITKEQIEGVVGTVTDTLKSVFEAPLQSIIDLFDFENVTETIVNFGALIKEKLDTFFDVLKSPFETITGFFSSVGKTLGIIEESTLIAPEVKAETVKQKLTVLSADNDLKTLQDSRTKEYESGLVNAKRQSIVLDNVERTTSLKEKQIMEREEKLRKRAEEVNQVNNNLVQSTQNNLVVREDLTTRSSDSNWVPSNY